MVPNIATVEYSHMDGMINKQLNQKKNEICDELMVSKYDVLVRVMCLLFSFSSPTFCSKDFNQRSTFWHVNVLKPFKTKTFADQKKEFDEK